MLLRLTQEPCELSISTCSSITASGFDFDDDEMEPLESALTLVVVASAGGDRLEVAFPSVSCREDVLLVFGLVGRLTGDSTSVAVLLAEDILSRAIWVRGAVLRGQVLLYQLYNRVRRMRSQGRRQTYGSLRLLRRVCDYARLWWCYGPGLGKFFVGCRVLCAVKVRISVFLPIF